MFHFSPSYSIHQKNEQDKLDQQGWDYFTCYKKDAAFIVVQTHLIFLRMTH